MDFHLGLMHPKGVGELETVRLTHEEADLITEKFGGNHSGLSHEGESPFLLPEESCRESGKASGSVTAHFCLATIGIVVAHPGKLGRALNSNQAISTDATVPITETSDLFANQAAGAVTVINHDEVIPSAVHFGELQSHPRTIAPAGRGVTP
jgi:hypothetical protein